MSSSSVLVINSGSSSIKYQLVDPETGDAIAKGIVERIGDTTGLIKHEHGEAVTKEELPVPDHTVGMREVLRLFDTEGPSLAEAHILAVGHRVVQGGRYFDGPALITDEVRNLIEELCPL
ncbi:MAG: acetate kinase, partial [Actinomyces sp.]|nr:acetate kinase [Actinomyces sp.]